MTSQRSNIISNILERIIFSDGTKIKPKLSKFIFKDNSFGCSLDISGFTLEEGEKIQKRIMYEISVEIPDMKTNIVLTSNKKPDQNNKDKPPKLILDGVKKICLIASGKGGVGKSTITALLAYKLKSMGMKVGIVDADIYGPSIPDIFGVNQKPELDDNKMIPLKKDGISINSIGFISAPEASISWRGPMASKALYQLLSLTKWEDLDYLLIDSPPGTGDIHLSLLQNYHIDEVYMVTTPQKISAIDVKRSINLYKKFNIKISGIIENMAYFQQDGDEEKINIFSGNAGQDISKKFNIPLTSQIPILPSLSHDCDNGITLEKYIDLLNIIN